MKTLNLIPVIAGLMLNYATASVSLTRANSTVFEDNYLTLNFPTLPSTGNIKRVWFVLNTDSIVDSKEFTFTANLFNGTIVTGNDFITTNGSITIELPQFAFDSIENNISLQVNEGSKFSGVSYVGFEYPSPPHISPHAPEPGAFTLMLLSGVGIVLKRRR